MKILLTGASGLVGAAFARLAAAHGHHVIGTVGGYSGSVPGLAEQRTVDLTDPATPHGLIAAVQPEVIVNAAAVAAPAECDAQPARSQVLNVALPALLAELAESGGMRLVHLSSEQVFDGTRTAPPYTAADEPRPINLYGRQKLASEQAVAVRAPSTGVIVRPPLLLGNSLSGQRSVHEALLRTWHAGQPTALYRDEFRQPCTADDLAAVMLELCGRAEHVGVYHWAGAELVSRYELGRRIAERFEMTDIEGLLRPLNRTASPAPLRPGCLPLDVSPLAAVLNRAPQRLSDQLSALQPPRPC